MIVIYFGLVENVDCFGGFVLGDLVFFKLGIRGDWKLFKEMECLRGKFWFFLFIGCNLFLFFI